MITLGIDTSNYATSVALVDNDTHKVIFSEKRFLPVEEGKIGLRQQQALFEHIKNLTNIFDSLKGIDIGAVGVSVRPKDDTDSYMPCFLAGKMSAYSIGGTMGVPVIEASHQTGHLTSALFDLNKEELFDNEAHIVRGDTDRPNIHYSLLPCYSKDITLLSLLDKVQKPLIIFDSIVEGFEHQLDQLYHADAMDVVSDIKVMETMLSRDTASAAKDFGYTQAQKTSPKGENAPQQLEI